MFKFYHPISQTIIPFSLLYLLLSLKRYYSILPVFFPHYSSLFSSFYPVKLSSSTSSIEIFIYSIHRLAFQKREIFELEARARPCVLEIHENEQYLAHGWLGEAELRRVPLVDRRPSDSDDEK